mmetsp:Transcript_4005/g.16006  ORF Transcript_4005/g.16006 Transcript_4005/m.16006 type:complete len:693 (+) Transcript_4005:2141-4219(+)
MVSLQPYRLSSTAPSRWLDECQNVALPSFVSKSHSSSAQSPSSGRWRSHSWPAPGDASSAWSSSSSSSTPGVEHYCGSVVVLDVDVVPAGRGDAAEQEPRVVILCAARRRRRSSSSSTGSSLLRDASACCRDGRLVLPRDNPVDRDRRESCMHTRHADARDRSSRHVDRVLARAYVEARLGAPAQRRRDGAFDGRQRAGLAKKVPRHGVPRAPADRGRSDAEHRLGEPRRDARRPRQALGRPNVVDAPQRRRAGLAREELGEPERIEAFPKARRAAGDVAAPRRARQRERRVRRAERVEAEELVVRVEGRPRRHRLGVAEDRRDDAFFGGRRLVAKVARARRLGRRVRAEPGGGEPIIVSKLGLVVVTELSLERVRRRAVRCRQRLCFVGVRRITNQRILEHTSDAAQRPQDHEPVRELRLGQLVGELVLEAEPLVVAEEGQRNPSCAIVRCRRPADRLVEARGDGRRVDLEKRVEVRRADDPVEHGVDPVQPIREDAAVVHPADGAIQVQIREAVLAEDGIQRPQNRLRVAAVRALLAVPAVHELRRDGIFEQGDAHRVGADEPQFGERAIRRRKTTLIVVDGPRLAHEARADEVPVVQHVRAVLAQTAQRLVDPREAHAVVRAVCLGGRRFEAIRVHRRVEPRVEREPDRHEGHARFGRVLGVARLAVRVLRDRRAHGEAHRLDRRKTSV